MTIPASTLVQVNPGVIAAGGLGLDVIALVVTQNTRVPIGTVSNFSTAAAVSSFFGASSNEATFAGVYFQGYNGSTKKPAALLFAQFPIATPVSGYLRGGNVSALTLAQLQAFSGNLTVTIDGVLTSGAVNLSGATSFSSAGQIINNALAVNGTSAATVSGTIAGSVLTVGSVISGGGIAVGMLVSGGTGVPAGTYVTGILTGSGGVGTYQLNQGGSASGTINVFNPAVAYDSISGAFVVSSGSTGSGSSVSYGSGVIATDLLLTQAGGAVISPGAGVVSTAAFMNSVLAITTDWVTFTTLFDPDIVLNTGSNTAKQAFAAWKNTQNQRFAYVCIDKDPSPTTTVPATTSLGYILANNADSGTFLMWEPTGGLHGAPFICGAAASINFEQTNGRITFAYKWQAGLNPGVTNQAIASDLLANGYNFGGVYGAASQNFLFVQNGSVTGPFAWFDSYINQIWLNNSFQLALLELLANSPSIPYDTAGNSLIEQALSDPIQAGLNFGAFAPGTISAAEAAAVNAAAGMTVDQTLQTQGYYLQVLPASSAARAARATPPINFWYLDRGSVQQITMASVELQ